jgi:hypothetical protein
VEKPHPATLLAVSYQLSAISKNHQNSESETASQGCAGGIWV